MGFKHQYTSGYVKNMRIYRINQTNLQTLGKGLGFEDIKMQALAIISWEFYGAQLRVKPKVYL